MSLHLPTQPVWVFDLDDTLHDASRHIFPVMHIEMTQYIMRHLALDELAAHQLRRHYWRVYGATLKGLMRHHGVKPAHFLAETHAFLHTPSMVVAPPRLRPILSRLPGRKQVFTNAPLHYARQVLQSLQVEKMFETVFSVEHSGYHPKPSVRGFRRMLKAVGADPKHCIMLEDNREALKTAKRLGMKTVLISRQLHRPNYVDKRITHIGKLVRF